MILEYHFLEVDKLILVHKMHLFHFLKLYILSQIKELITSYFLHDALNYY